MLSRMQRRAYLKFVVKGPERLVHGAGLAAERVLLVSE